ncbi:MAG: phosphoribosylanthranilate isomerase, partial [Caldimonas sp.]
MNQRTRIKICGIAREADVEAAAEAGADAVGFVFYPPSPRCLTLTQAVALARRLPPFVAPVALFVNAEPAAIEAVTDAIADVVLQFHGDETPADCERHGRPYLKAARMTPGLDLLDCSRRFSAARALVLDAHVEGYGGAGKAFDWSLVPQGVSHPLVLSGGLHAENVVAGILQ